MSTPIPYLQITSIRSSLRSRKSSRKISKRLFQPRMIRQDWSSHTNQCRWAKWPSSTAWWNSSSSTSEGQIANSMWSLRKLGSSNWRQTTNNFSQIIRLTISGFAPRSYWFGIPKYLFILSNSQASSIFPQIHRVCVWTTVSHPTFRRIIHFHQIADQFDFNFAWVWHWFLFHLTDPPGSTTLHIILHLLRAV